MSFDPGSRYNRSAGRAARHRETVEQDVAGRRLMKEAKREERLASGLPVHHRLLARLRRLWPGGTDR